MNELFKVASMASRGTLMQLKHYFGHASLQRNVMANVQHTWDMIEVTTDYSCCFGVIIQKCISEANMYRRRVNSFQLCRKKTALVLKRLCNFPA